VPSQPRAPEPVELPIIEPDAPDAAERRAARDAALAAFRAAEQAHATQSSLLARLRVIAEDAKTFSDDTGVHALHVGLPVISLPANQIGTNKRVIAPIAFVPITLTVRTGRAPAVEIAAAGTGADLLQPNMALLAWVEQQTGTRFGELFEDADGTAPWRELAELVELVCRALQVPIEKALDVATPLVAMPRSDSEDVKQPRLLAASVLGLFPMTNQSLLRDLEAMAEGEKLAGPVESFVRVDVALVKERDAGASGSFGGEHLISHADPCQARAVRLAQRTVGLVIHGPPGTGKSQTITNVIGDHLARGERVLFVCDKRTAIDVVQHRLAHLGLGHLTAIVHDATRDQRELYRSIREQLDALPDAKPAAQAVGELAALDREVATLHQELLRHHRALHEPPSEHAQSFHALFGEFMEARAACGDQVGVNWSPMDVPLDALVPTEKLVREVLERGRSVGWPGQPWRGQLGLSLTDFLARPVADTKKRLDAVVDAAVRADETVVSGLPELYAGDALIRQSDALQALGDDLATVGDAPVPADPSPIARWAAASAETLANADGQLAALAPYADKLARPLDPELAIVERSASLPVAQIMVAIAQLSTYLAIARKWYAWFCRKRRRDAREQLQRFGLVLGADNAERVVGFLNGLRARRLLSECHDQVLQPGGPGALVPDHQLRAAIGYYGRLFGALRRLAEPTLAACAQAIRAALTDIVRRTELVTALRGVKARAAAITAIETTLADAKLFAPSLVERLSRELRAGGKLALYCGKLAEQADAIEGVLRIERALAELPAPIASVARELLERGVDAETGWNVVRGGIIAAELARRLAGDSILSALDGDGIRVRHERYRGLLARKRALTVATIVHRWTTRARERLLASTGSRLNGAGAELRRRLLLRGERALRLRQVISIGSSTADGDPIFDLRPVWMASPETVAQIFPRAPLFDVVIFDEASQCRLEEALPVLTRARRVVIAGDPKQLPPTRFFESAIAQSHDSEAETEQELFEEQQGEVEDLLGAALNLEIEQCYLDVHYRSRNADLIEFSNHSFYDSRLQAIPGHPKNRASHAPLGLVPVAGVYDKRANPAEAAAVVHIVKDLLAREHPPSIGIACFSLTQRDCIVDALDAAASADPEFGGRLAAARVRRGAGSFEGLFVKNLENVQGDERDHMIISTTYGPDPKGRFYRRFGPLGRAGGGRRLNVLVTRAREQVHLVTSIPAEVYRALPALEPGRTPNGAWLLFSYLQYAERLAELYRKEAERLAVKQLSRSVEPAGCQVRDSATGSPVAIALGRQLAIEHGLASDAHWGNEGFCVDVALRHPLRAEDVTIGVLTDATRFDKAADPVEWDQFRMSVLEAQGWKLFRLWTPQMFRDLDKSIAAVVETAAKFVAEEAPVPPPLVVPERPSAPEMLN
jgi:hypothetical protein